MIWKKEGRNLREGYLPMTFLAAISMSSAFMVLRPACIAKSKASLAILTPISSRALANSLAAASLTLSAPAFLHSLCMGATANSKSAINDPQQLLFLFKAIFNLFCCSRLLKSAFDIAESRAEKSVNNALLHYHA